MASIEKRGEKYRVVFRIGDKKYARSLKTDKLQKAQIALSQIERNLELVSLGMLEIPSDCDVFDFLLTGKRPATPTTNSTASPRKNGVVRLSLEKLFELYFDAFLKESIEANSYSMLQTHRNNLQRLIGKKKNVKKFSTGDFQRYVDKRAKEDGKRGKIKPVTIRKEITTLSTIFDWAVGNDHLEAVPSKKGVRYPKGKEKPPFQTWNEIERKVARGGLTDDAIAELWESLFLNTEQIDELLKHVKNHARHDVIYPMFAFAAHTGARRSEIARSTISDLDFDSSIITIRELKRVRGMQSSRRVPMSPFLQAVLTSWLKIIQAGK